MLIFDRCIYFNSCNLCSRAMGWDIFLRLCSCVCLFVCVGGGGGGGGGRLLVCDFIYLWLELFLYAFSVFMCVRQKFNVLWMQLYKDFQYCCISTMTVSYTLLSEGMFMAPFFLVTSRQFNGKYRIYIPRPSK